MDSIARNKRVRKSSVGVGQLSDGDSGPTLRECRTSAQDLSTMQQPEKISLPNAAPIKLSQYKKDHPIWQDLSFAPFGFPEVESWRVIQLNAALKRNDEFPFPKAAPRPLQEVSHQKVEPLSSNTPQAKPERPPPKSPLLPPSAAPKDPKKVSLAQKQMRNSQGRFLPPKAQTSSSDLLSPISKTPSKPSSDSPAEKSSGITGLGVFKCECEYTTTHGPAISTHMKACKLAPSLDDPQDVQFFHANVLHQGGKEYTCRVCGVKSTYPPVLLMHLKTCVKTHKQQAPEQSPPHKRPRPEDEGTDGALSKTGRLYFTDLKRKHLLLKLDALTKSGLGESAPVVCSKICQVSPSHLAQCFAKRPEIDQSVNKKKPAGCEELSRHVAALRGLEGALCSELRSARTQAGGAGGGGGPRVTARWIQLKARQLSADQPLIDPQAKFKASRAWLCGFMHRNRLTFRVGADPTADVHSCLDRLPAIQSWHARFKELLQVDDLGNRIEGKFGRFLPENRFSMSQVPLPFVCRSVRASAQPLHTTRGEWGSQAAAVAAGAGGGGAHSAGESDTRLATLQCTVRMVGAKEGGGGHAQIKQTIIFRGTGRSVSEEETSKYDPRVRVLWQPKGFSDKLTCLEWAFLHFNDQVSGLEGEKVLIADNQSGHTSRTFLKGMRESGTCLHLLPHELSPYLQVVERGVGKQIQQELVKVHEEWMEKGGEERRHLWSAVHPELECGVMGMAERRVLITQWVAEACDRVFQRTDMVRLFEESGLGLAADGSNDAAVRLPGVDNYTFSTADAGSMMDMNIPVKDEDVIFEEEDIAEGPVLLIPPRHTEEEKLEREEVQECIDLEEAFNFDSLASIQHNKKLSL